MDQTRKKITEVDGHKIWCLKTLKLKQVDHYVAMFEIMDVNPIGLVRLKCTWRSKIYMKFAGYEVGSEYYSEKYDRMVNNKSTLDGLAWWYPVTDTEYVMLMMED